MSAPASSTELPRDYSWAEYLDCMEGGSDVLTLPPSRPAALPARKDQPVWGLLLTSTITLGAIWVSELPLWPFTTAGGRHPIEPVMLAIILGMVISNSWKLPAALQSGIKFSIKKLLPLGIVLLGARLNFMAVVQVGLAGILLSLLEIVVALALLIFLARRFALPRKLGLLLGVGTAICGGTAIVATAPVIEAEEKDVVFSVATVTLLGLILMFLLPLIGTGLALSERAFGIWAGLAIHQTPQVIAAGFAYGPEAGETATIVKLARVCLLAPVVFLIGVIYARGKVAGGTGEKRINYLHLFPMFVLGFLGMALLRTLGLIPDVAVHFPDAALLGSANHDLSLPTLAGQFSKLFIIVSMAAVGLETKFSSMKQTGLKPFLASLIAVLVIAALLLALIQMIEAQP